MLMGSAIGGNVRHNDKEGLWAVRDGSIQYDSWACWLWENKLKRHFPIWMTLPSEWPPTTQSGADAFALWLSNVRDDRYQNDKGPVGGAPVPVHPSPWDGDKCLPPSVAQRRKAEQEREKHREGAPA